MAVDGVCSGNGDGYTVFMSTSKALHSNCHKSDASQQPGVVTSSQRQQHHHAHRTWQRRCQGTVIRATPARVDKNETKRKLSVTERHAKHGKEEWRSEPEWTARENMKQQQEESKNDCKQRKEGGKGEDQPNQLNLECGTASPMLLSNALNDVSDRPNSASGGA